jgi:WD40 repeat protein
MSVAMIPEPGMRLFFWNGLMTSFNQLYSSRPTRMRRRRRIRKMMVIVQLLMALSWFCARSLAAENQPTGHSGQEVDYYRDVFPILESKCLACHNGSHHESGLVLESSEALLRGGETGPAVVPGSPEQSRLFLAAAGRGDSPMPPMPNPVQATPLDTGELGRLRDWIAQGAKPGVRPNSEALQWQPIPETYKSVYSLALFPNQRYLAAGRGNRIFLYDLLSEREICRLSDPALMSLQRDHQPLYGTGVAHRDFVHSLAVSPDGRLLASGGYRTIKLWERQGPREIASLLFPGKYRTCGISPSGNLVACVLETNEVLLWNAQTAILEGRLSPREQRVNCLCFTADGSTVVTAGEGGLVEFWQTADRTRAGELATSSSVSSLALRSHGSEVITAHQDGTCRLWHRPSPKSDETSGEPAASIRTFSGSGDPVTGISLVHDRSELVVASRGGNIRIWNVDNGSTIQTLTARAPLAAFTASQDGTSIVTFSEGHRPQLWNRNGQSVVELSRHPKLAAEVDTQRDLLEISRQRMEQAKESLTRAEKNLAESSASLQLAREQQTTAEHSFSDAEAALKESDAKLRLADERLAQAPNEPAFQQAQASAVENQRKIADAHSQAKMALITASRLVELSEQGGRANREQKARIEHKLALLQEEVERNAHTLQLAQEHLEDAVQVITSMACPKGDPILITAGLQQQVQTWSLPAGQSIEPIDFPGTQPIEIHDAANNLLLTVDGTGKAVVWNTAPRWELKTILGPPADEPLQLESSRIIGRVYTVAFSPDGRLLASGGGEPSRSGELLIWNLETKLLQQEISDAHSDTILDIEFTRDGQQLVSGGADRFVKLFDVNAGRLIRSFEGHMDHILGVAVKADGNTLASAGADRVIKIWNAETGEQRRTIDDYSRQVTAISFVGIGEDLLSCSGDRHVKFHKASTGQSDRSFVGSLDYVYSAIASSDERLVIAGGEDGVVRVWNGLTGEQIATFAPPSSVPQSAPDK